MNKWTMRGAQLLGYCVPFSFLAMYGDAEFRSIWLYLVMILGFGDFSCGLLGQSNTA